VPHQVQIANGQVQIGLPDGNLYQSGDTVTLTDAEYDAISPNAFTDGYLTDLGAIPAEGTAGATAGRPSASSAGVGSSFYDETLHKPIWSDGTAWRDATGSTV
jgi:hypothetical protein